MCRSLGFALSIAAAALLLAWAIRPPQRWLVHEDGRILLDSVELSVANHPPLFAGINAALHFLPPRWLRWLIPLRYDYLLQAAASKAAAELDRVNSDRPRLLRSTDLDADLGTLTSSGEPCCVQGLHELLVDLDGDTSNGEDRAPGAAAVGGLSPLGRFMTQQQLISSLATQMKWAALLDGPEGSAIRGVAVPAPIVIVGPPRTGTTLLHRTIATHPEVRFLPYYEGLEPVRFSGSDVDEDPRIPRTHAAMSVIHALRPLFQHMHVMGAHVPFEEMQLSAHCFSSMLFETSLGDTPRYSAWFRRVDQTFGYQCIRLALQVLSYERPDSPASRWVLKTPQHTLFLKQLLRVFPDAVVVLTTREPVDAARSLLPLLAYSRGVQGERVDLARHGEMWIERLREILLSQERDGLRLFPHAIEADFGEWVGNVSATEALLKRIFSTAGLSTAERELEHVMAFVVGEMAGGSRTKFIYDFAAFGLDEDQVRRELKAPAE